MWDLIDEKLAEKSGAKKGEMIKKYTEDLTALGRTSVPEDVAKVVGFLSGPDSDFMTGQTVVVSTCLVLNKWSILTLDYRWTAASFSPDAGLSGHIFRKAEG